MSKRNFSSKGFSIESRIFTKEKGKTSIFEKIGGFKGCNVLLQMYKFRYPSQETDHTFGLSLSALRRETKNCLVKKGYSTEEIYNILKAMQGCGLIKLKTYNRWSQLINGKTGELDSDKFIEIEATNPFPIRKFTKEEVEQYKKNEEYFIYVPLDLFQHMTDKGLDERCFILYCFIKRWSNSKKFDNRCFMSMKKIAEHLDCSDKLIKKLIEQLRQNRYLCIHSYKSRRGLSGHAYSILRGLGEEFVISFEKENRDILKDATDVTPSLSGDRLEELLESPTPKITELDLLPDVSDKLSEWSLEIKYTEKYK